MRLTACCFGLLLFSGCNDCPEINQKIPLTCLPCNGHGEPIVIVDERPIAIAHILRWDLCFAAEVAERCWYGCPGTIEESVTKGADICQGGK